MESHKFTAPVLLLVFNNPVTTKLAFEEVRRAKPQKLYVAADGPDGDTDQIEKCVIARSIATHVDWECEVQTLFNDQYVGGGKAITNAINWFFRHETEGIVIEYDSLPVPTFFPYCSALLEKYRNDKRIMMIGGARNGTPAANPEYSYFFSNHNSRLAWATWKRAWEMNEYPMSHFQAICKKGYFDDLFNTISEEHYFESVFGRKTDDNNVWNYKWELSRRINSGLTIIPQQNLVSNIGSGGIYNKVFQETLDFPLRHPELIMVDAKADQSDFNTRSSSFQTTVKTAIKSMLPHFIRKKIFEASFKKHLAAFAQAAEREQDPTGPASLASKSEKKPTTPDWEILKALTDRNRLRFFSWANMSLTMCEFDLDVFCLVMA